MPQSTKISDKIRKFSTYFRTFDMETTNCHKYADKTS